MSRVDNIDSDLESVTFSNQGRELNLKFVRTKYDFYAASCLIRDARNTRLQIPYKTDTRSMKIYELYYHPGFQIGYYFFLWLNLSLILIESPQSFRSYFVVPYWVVVCLHLLCLIYFIGHWFHQLHCSDKRNFWKNPINVTTMVIICLMFVDIFIFTIMKYASPGTLRVQWSRALRPVLCATFPENYKIRAALVNIRGTLVDVSVVFSLFLFMLAFFSLITLQFIMQENLYYPNGKPYFRSFLDVLFELYVLVTTSNSPDVIVPAYEQSGFYILLYLSVCVVCNWIFMGIVVASVYSAYKSHLGAHVIDTVTKKKKRLQAAFDLLKNPQSDTVSTESFVTVIQKVEPKNSNAKNMLLFNLLDNSNKNQLKVDEFTKLTEYMCITFEEIPMNKEYFNKHLPAFYVCYMSKVNQFFIPIIRSVYTKLFFELLVLINAVTMIVFYGSTYETPLEWAFTFIFMSEIILRLFASGLNLYFRDIWNVFDFVVVAAALVSFVVEQIILLFMTDFKNQFIRILLACRVLRLLKVITVVSAFRMITHCIVILLPSLFAYAAIQLSIYYIYVCIGMEVFGNLYSAPVKNKYGPLSNLSTDCGNKRLVNSDFIQLHYCIFNFNSALDGFLFMVILTVSNNWHILLTGASLPMGKPVKLFFITIHIVCVLLVMNIVLAFIIDAYMMEVDNKQSNFKKNIINRLDELNINADTELKKRGLAGYGSEKFDLSKEMLEEAFPPGYKAGSTCFRINDSSPKDMEALLNRMFEEDIQTMHNQHFNKNQNEHRLSFIQLLKANSDKF